MREQPTLFIIEPQELFVPHLRWLALEADLPIAGATAGVDPFALRVAAPDVVLIDVDYLEDGASPTVRCVRELLPQAAIVALADLRGPHASDALRAAGASAVVAKSAGEVELVAALDALRRARP